MVIALPLSVAISSRKRFTLNLNVYRNSHHSVLNKAKVNYTEIILPLLRGLNVSPPCVLIYRYFAPTKRRVDIANVCSIIDKFTSDALVKAGVIEDDKTEIIRCVRYEWGGVDRDNPRCELRIESF